MSVEIEAPTLTPAQMAFAKRRRLIPAIIGAGLFMHNLDSTIIANALPTMARDLHESPLTLNLAITVYLLSSAIFLPISGWIADRYGARRVFMTAIGAFAVSSLLCGMAHDILQIVGARFLQGMAGALMIPVGRLVLLKSAPKSDLVSAMATLTMPALLGPILGPPVGGFIVSFASWRWIFWMNVPVAILGVLLIFLYVPSVYEEERTPLDVKGFFLSMIGLGGLVFGVQNLGRGVLPFWAALALMAIGAVGCFWFARHAARVRYPILDLLVLRVPTYFVANVGGVFARIAAAASPFLVALLLQMGFGMSAFAAGSISCAGAIGALSMKPAAPRILRAFGFRSVLIGNSILVAVTMGIVALFTPTTPLWVLAPCLAIGGFFRSLQFTALNALAFADVPPEQLSRSSALSSVGQQITQSVGASIAASLVHGMMLLNHTERFTPGVVSPAFLAIGVLALGGCLFFVRMPDNAGADVSGWVSRPR